MIGSFWNLCRACPSMPVDKLHSEYRSTYKWHEYTGPRQDVVRRAPQPGASANGNAPKLRPTRSTEEDGTGSTVEPALPRRKKHPELAYRTHEIIDDRARSEERGSGRARPARRSKSEGPPQSEYRLQFAPADRDRSDSDQEDQDMMHSSLPPAPATEYRLQFAWRGAACKSLSMGAIRPTPVHTKKSGAQGPSELEPLVPSEARENTRGFEDGCTEEEKIQKETVNKEGKLLQRKEYKTEYKKKFRPFSHYDYVEGRFFKKKHSEAVQVPLLKPQVPRSDSWYCEVLELRKKAGEYKHRGWGTELVPQHIAQLYNKQMMLWEQVSRRSSLSALSLAATSPRSISKEEKDKENSKKSSPTKLSSNHRKLGRVTIRQEKATHLQKLRDEKKEELNEENAEEKKEENKDDMKEEVKWEESKKEDLKSEELKKDLPRTKREYLIRHHLERTTGASDGALLPSPTREKLEPVLPRPKDEEAQNKSPQKSSPKFSPRAVRSHSVGTENRSPKRMLRGPSSVAPVHNGVTQPEKRPRPTSLTTSGPSRPKSSSAPLKPEDGKSHHTVKAKTMSGVQADERTKVAETKESSAEPEKKDDDSLHEVVTQVKDEAEPAVVKSPPEPTRVKSPEQIIMRSPEPVNWTVPLDTGKTFTVTQNVHEGEIINRPHSEVKAWTPPAVPPPAPQSAPPELAEQEQPLSAGWNPETSEIHCRDKDETVNGLEDSSTDETQIKCLGTEDTSVVEPSVPIVSPSSGRSLASDVLEKARTRFDQFWGKGKDSPDREGKV